MDEARKAYLLKQVEEIKRFTMETHRRDALRAEIEILLVEDLHGAMTEFASEIRLHREELHKAAESSERSSGELSGLTRALVTATNRYVLLTGGLLVLAFLNLLCRR